MGFGQIVGGGPAGRYTLRLDYGEATRDATLAALNAQLVKLDNDLASAQAELSAAQVKVDEAQTAIADATNAFILAGGTGNLSDTAVQAALFFLEQQRKASIDAQRLTISPRLRVNAIKLARAQVLAFITQFTAAVVVQTKDAWCTDYTEDGAGYVATIDIDGAPDLTLIAPGARSWVSGDGLIATATKTAKINALNASKARHEAAKASAQARKATLEAQETAAKALLAAAQAGYVSAPPEAKPGYLADMQRYQADVLTLSSDIAAVTVQIAQSTARIAAVDAEILVWQAKASTDTPQPGDGLMTASAVMSPEQTFVNAAILPGWQKFKPTYRWGTLTALDKDANTASVSLFAATSSAQSLGINQASTLSAVPVVYMTCHARAFEVGDRVVVQFMGQDWSAPRVVGFLDNPKPCIQYVASYYVRGYGPLSFGNLHLLDEIEKDKDEPWGAFTSITPVSPWKFLQWSDAVATLTRDDGLATANISRTAQYTYAPHFQCDYSWTIEAYSTSGPYVSGPNFVRDWEVKIYGSVSWRSQGLFGNVATTPAAANFDTVVWSGQAIDGFNPDDVVYDLTGGATGVTSGGGPLTLPSYPATSSQTVVFVLSGSANQYSVTGSKTTDPYPGAQIPLTTGSGTGSVAEVLFNATSWSATYA